MTDGVRPKTIMLVDDEPQILRVVARILEVGGYAVVTLNTGFGLSHKVREHRPDLMLLDVSMPGLGGAAALSVMRSLGQRFPELDVPVVFHSGLGEATLEELARRHGAAGFLCKPSGATELLELVASVLEPMAASAEMP